MTIRGLAWSSQMEGFNIFHFHIICGGAFPRYWCQYFQNNKKG